MRRQLFRFWVTVGVLTLFPGVVHAQEELLLNPGLETTVANSGPYTAPPDWTLEEGPRVPSQPAPDPLFPEGPYLGDYNNGGVPVIPCPDTYCNAVDAADYVVWRENLGQPFALPNRHPSLSGNVNGFDYDVWKSRFGSPRTMDLAQPGNFTHRLLEGSWHMWFEPYNGTEAEAEDNFAHLYQMCLVRRA